MPNDTGGLPSRLDEVAYRVANRAGMAVMHGMSATADDCSRGIATCFDKAHSPSIGDERIVFAPNDQHGYGDMGQIFDDRVVPHSSKFRHDSQAHPHIIRSDLRDQGNGFM